MSRYVFLFKDNANNQDRDCVAYVEIERLKDRSKDIVGRFTIHGACYCTSFGNDYTNSIYDYDDVTTILTREEFNLMQGGEVTDDIINKLLSDENQVLFDTVIQEEREYLSDEYGLDEEDINEIFDTYYLDYRDRGIVSYVYKDAYDCGYEEAESLGITDSRRDDIASRYFDYERFGEDLIEDEYFLELSDKRVVRLNY